MSDKTMLIGNKIALSDWDLLKPGDIVQSRIKGLAYEVTRQVKPPYNTESGRVAYETTNRKIITWSELWRRVSV
jgi:hypothetical protein